MKLGAHYRTPSGCIYELERIGTSSVDPCVLRCVEIGSAVMSVLGGWAHDRTPSFVSNPDASDSDLVRVERELRLIDDEEDRLKFLVGHIMGRRLEVEPAWFEYMGKEIGA